uniref:Uncharacterized protein n=1 Tax=Glossina pallidipes TaxID=7398 RepID=A0A1A9ZA89_GLOPL
MNRHLSRKTISHHMDISTLNVILKDNILHLKYITDESGSFLPSYEAISFAVKSIANKLNWTQVDIYVGVLEFGNISSGNSNSNSNRKKKKISHNSSSYTNYSNNGKGTINNTRESMLGLVPFYIIAQVVIKAAVAEIVIIIAVVIISE